MRTIQIGGDKYRVSPKLDGFVIKPTPSSTNSILFAINTLGNKLLVKFKNGNQYMYSNVPDKIIVHAPNVESISKFVNTYIKPNADIKTERDHNVYFEKIVQEAPAE
jgi:hypothetical protein